MNMNRKLIYNIVVSLTLIFLLCLQAACEPADDDNETSTTTTTIISDTGWQNVTDTLTISTPTGHDFAMHNGTLYLALCDHDNDLHATVMQFDGGDWLSVGKAGFSDNRTQMISITVDTVTGHPYVAFKKIYNYSLTDGHGSVMGYNGTYWYYLGDPAFTTHDVYLPVPAALEGHVYLAYNRSIISGDYPFLVLFDRSTDDWTYRDESVLDDFELPYPDGLDLVYEDQTLYLAFRTTDKRANVVAKSLGPTGMRILEVLGSPGFSTPAQSFTDLDVDEGTPYVAYVEESTGRVVVMRFDGADWIELGDTGAVSIDTVALLVRNGIPYIVFTDTDRRLKVLARRGDQWQSLDYEGLATNDILQSNGPVLTADTDNVYLCYLERDTKATGSSHGTVRVVVKAYSLLQ